MLKSSVLLPAPQPAPQQSHSCKIDAESALKIAGKAHEWSSAAAKLGLRRRVRALLGGAPCDEAPDEDEDEDEADSHDSSGDERIPTQELLNEAAVRMLCGYGGVGFNLGKEETDNEVRIKYLYRELDTDPVEREYRRARILFDQFDEDKDGYLDENELSKLLKATYEGITHPERSPPDEWTQYYHEIMNSARSGKVSKEEFEIFSFRALKSRNIQF